MRIGRVIGKVTLSKQEPSYRGGRFLVVSPMGRKELSEIDREQISDQPSVVVYDQRGAGLGEIITFVEGTEATAPFDHPIPIDNYNVAILDRIQYKP